MRARGSLAVVIVSTAVGCSPAPKPASTTQAVRAAPPAVASTIDLDALGLRIDIPGGATVAAGARPGSVVVTSSSGWRLTVDEGSSSDTLAVALAAAERLDAKNVVTQQTDDGHWMTFERTGRVGATYGVHLVHRFETHVYRCEGLVAHSDEARAVLAACKTLRR